MSIELSVEDLDFQIEQLRQAKQQLLVTKQATIFDTIGLAVEKLVAEATPCFDSSKLDDEDFILQYFKSTQDAACWLGQSAYSAVVKRIKQCWEMPDSARDIPDEMFACLKPFCISAWNYKSSSWVEHNLPCPVSSNGYYFAEVFREQLDSERVNIVYALVKQGNDNTVVDRTIAGAYCYIQTSGVNDSYGGTHQSTVDDAKVVKPTQVTQVVFK